MVYNISYELILLLVMRFVKLFTGEYVKGVKFGCEVVIFGVSWSLYNLTYEVLNSSIGDYIRQN